MTRQRPERLPFTYSAAPETTAALGAAIGLGPDVQPAEHFKCNWLATPWMLLGGGPSLPEREARNTDPDVAIDIWGRKTRRPQAGDGRETLYRPLAAAETIADVEAHDWPRVDEVVFPDIPAGLDLVAAKQDVVVMLWRYPNVFSLACGLRGMEQIMTDLALDPGIAEAIVANIEAFNLGCMEVILAKYPGLIDLVRSSDDWGTQGGLMISRAMAERFFMPTMRRYFELGRRHGALGYQHSCGAVFDMLPAFIEAGVEVLNPIQTSAAGMEPARLKREFGRRLAFHGGIDTQQTLVTGSPVEVRAEVRQRIDTLGPSGYILAPSHNLQPDVPAANIVAMYEEALDYGGK